MDYKGKKVWFFRVIPLVYSSNQVDWAVDVENPMMNKLADAIVTHALKICAAASIPVILSQRHAKTLVKNQPSGGSMSGHHLT